MHLIEQNVIQYFISGLITMMQKHQTKQLPQYMYHI